MRLFRYIGVVLRSKNDLTERMIVELSNNVVSAFITQHVDSLKVARPGKTRLLLIVPFKKTLIDKLFW